MTFDDDGLPGNREVLERELGRSATQVLHLAPATSQHRSLVERGADAVRGFEVLPSDIPPVPAPSVVEAASRDGIPADIAEAYMRAKTEVKTILADHLNEVIRDP